MIAFLVSTGVVCVLIFAGYRVNMYLYAQGAVGDGVRQVESAGEEFVLVGPVHGVRHEGQDYGVRYARIGILYVAGILLVLAMVIVVILSSVL